MLPGIALALALAAAAPSSAAGPRALHLPKRPLVVLDTVVVVDPGHGGTDSGAIHRGLSEADVNLAVARDLSAILLKDGYRVLITRDENCRPEMVASDKPPAGPPGPAGQCKINLRDRILFALDYRPSVFLSLHTDWWPDPNVRGPHVYYGEGSEVQRALATDIQQELDSLRLRPVEPGPAKHFVLMAQPNMPAVTIEMGFITNPHDHSALRTKEYQQAIAHAVARGLEQYAAGHPLSPAPPVDRAYVDRLWIWVRSMRE
jgi:N-acetylmuramoyl-L-alanine amidase